MTTEGIYLHALVFISPSAVGFYVHDQIVASIAPGRPAFPPGPLRKRCHHQYQPFAQRRTSPQGQQLADNALSLVMFPLNGPGTPTIFNADVSVNPASTMKLVTCYAALEMLGPIRQWKTEFYTDGTLSNGMLRGNLYLKGGGDPKLNMQELWLLMRDLRANGVPQVTVIWCWTRTSSCNRNCRNSTTTATTTTSRSWSSPMRCWSTSRPCVSSRAMMRPGAGLGRAADRQHRIDNQVKALNSKQCTGDVRYSPVTQPDGSVTVTVGASWRRLQLADLPVAARPRHLHRRRRARDLEGTGRHHPGQGYAAPSRSAKVLARAFSPDLRKSSATSTNTVTTPWPSSCS